MDEKKETYLQKLMRSSKDLRYIIENYLLPEGSFSLLGLTRDQALHQDFENLLANLKRLRKLEFVFARIKLMKEYGKVDIVFFAHKDLVTEMTQDISLRNKAARKMSFNNTILAQRSKEIDTYNKNVMYQYLKENGVNLLDLTTLPLDKLTPFISNRPFAQEFNNFDKITEISAALKCEYNKEYFARLLNKKKVELHHIKKTTKLKEIVFGTLEDAGLVKLDDAVKAIRDKDRDISDLEIKNILNLSRNEFIITSVSEYHETEAEVKSYKAMASKGFIEFQQGGSPVPIKKILKEDEIVNVLLKKLLLTSIHTNQTFDLNNVTKEQARSIYVIPKKTTAGLIYELLESDISKNTGNNFLKLKIFSQIIEEHRKPLHQRMMEGGTIGTQNEKTNLGFSSFEELSSVSKRLLGLIALTEEMRVKEEKIRLWNLVFSENFFANFFSVLFPNKVYKDLKEEIKESSGKIKDYKRALQGKLGGKRIGPEKRIINMIIDSIKKAGLNPLQVSSVKNRMEGEPEILLTFVQGKTATVFKDIISRGKAKTITDELYKKLGDK